MPTGRAGHVGRVGIAGVLAAIGVLAGASTSRADTDPRSIAIPLIGTQGQASRYPSTQVIFGQTGSMQRSNVRIVLHRVTHPCPEDLAILLVHSFGASEKFLIMSNAGGCRPLQGTSITITAGETALPDNQPVSPAHTSTLSIGPSNYGVVPTFPAPAPAGPYTLGMPLPNGLVGGGWSLYVIDTHEGNRGVIAAGWSILFDDLLGVQGGQNVAIPGVGTGPGGAAQYPIEFNLNDARAEARVTQVACTLLMNHSYPDNLRIVLESPAGTTVVLMANAGLNNAMPFNTSLFFTDEGPAQVSNSGTITPGVYRPGGAYEANHSVGPPGPQQPYATAFSAFHNEPIRGTWRLWVYDDSAMNSGNISNSVLWIDATPIASASITSPAAAVSSSTQPFIRIEGVVNNAVGPLTTDYSVTWYASNGGAYYDSGPAAVRIGSDTFTADVPLKQGANQIAVFLSNRNGHGNLTTRTVNVSEFTYSLSEGATGGFFDLDVSIGNADTIAAPINIDFLPEVGGPIARADVVAAQSPLQIRVDDIVPNAAVSTVIHSTSAVPLVVERTMSWDVGGYGGHGGSAVNPATRWLFAEGSQGYFDTYVLLANDGNTQADVTVNFLFEGGGVFPHAISVPAHSRRTVDASTIPSLINRSFGIDISSTQPITAERSMYFPHNGARVFEGGHESAGVNETSRGWLLAEGATGPFFQCYLLLMNPNAVAANVSVTYLLPDGSTVVQPVAMPANSRSTIDVETVDASLANTPVSMQVSADVGIIAERGMYWPDISVGWREAHNSFGLTQLGLRWGVADGRIGGPRGHETYILLANPNIFPSEVQVRFLKAGGASATRTYTLPPTSRLNVWSSQEVPELGEGLFTAEIQVLNYIPIAVEKAMYWNADGIVWAAGTSVTATRLPPR